MKKRSIHFPILKPAFVFLFSLLVFKANAQVYFGASSGYGFGMAKQMIASDITGGASGFYLQGGLFGSFGKGFRQSVFGGYQFSEHLSYEIGFEYLSGSKLRFSMVDTFESNRTLTIERIAGARMTNIVPALRITIGEKKIKTYIRTGLLIGVKGWMLSESINTTEDSWGSNINSSKDECIEEYRGGIAWGFAGGFGMNYSLSKWLSFFTEAVIHAQTWSPLKSSITKYTYNGVDALVSMPVSSKEFEYKETVTTNNLQAASNLNEPTISLKRYYPFSSYGISFGIILKFPRVKDAPAVPSTNEQL